MLRTLLRTPQRKIALGAVNAAALSTFIPQNSKNGEASYQESAGSLVLSFSNPEAKHSSDLRIAISAFGASKSLASDIVEGGKIVPVWKIENLKNMAMPGIDEDYACGEDALVVSHTSFDGVKDYKDKNYKTYPTEAASSFFKSDSDVLSVSYSTSPVSGVLLGVADGVGGMAVYENNDTTQMSHKLMEYCGDALQTKDQCAKEVLQKGFNTLVSRGNIKNGACTATLTHIKPSEKNPGNLSFSFANLGDSLCVAIRPVHQNLPEDINEFKYIPLCMALPTYHKGNRVNLPPIQMALTPEYPDRSLNPVLKSHEPSHYGCDVPWMAQEGYAELKKGDIIFIFSDGIADNIVYENIAYPSMIFYNHAINLICKEPLAVPFISYNDPKFAKQSSNQRISRDVESVIAGNLSIATAYNTLRYAQRCWKIDDMSIIVGVVH